MRVPRGGEPLTGYGGDAVGFRLAMPARVVAVVMAAVFAGFFLAVVLFDYPDDLQATLRPVLITIAAAAWVVCGFIVWRAFRVALIVDDDGIHVFPFGPRYFIAWNGLTGISLHRPYRPWVSLSSRNITGPGGLLRRREAHLALYRYVTGPDPLLDYLKHRWKTANRAAAD